jgi:hypothetical protein
MNHAPIRTAPGTPEAGYLPDDDLRHRAAPGERMRDSLFWQCVMPEERVGFQAYLYTTSDGKAGFNVAVIGPGRRPLALDLVEGQIPDEADFDELGFAGLRLVQPANSGRARLTYRSERVRLDYDFVGLHEPFSYRQNPDGLPDWFAKNRLEQTGWVKGAIEFNGRRIVLDRIGHRDHSWGMRQWTVPQHWKWLIAYTPDASRIVNGWIWIARGEWGVGGYVVRDGVLTAISHVRQRAAYDDDMTQRRIEVEITDVAGNGCVMQLERFGHVKLPAGGKHATMIIEAACTAVIDGRPGAGQFETQWPQAYLDHLKELKAKG